MVHGYAPETFAEFQWHTTSILVSQDDSTSLSPMRSSWNFYSVSTAGVNKQTPKADDTTSLLNGMSL